MVTGCPGVASTNTRVLVETGPQVMRPDVPASLGRLRSGIVRMGYQPLPADYAYVEYVQSRVARLPEGLTFLGFKVDLWG